MNAIFSTSQIRHIEQSCRQALGHLSLMERAAGQITQWLKNHVFNQQHILFLAGPGNNGGDALLAALQLSQERPDLSITLWLVAEGGRFSKTIEENLQKQKLLSNLFIQFFYSDTDWFAAGPLGQNSGTSTASASSQKHLQPPSPSRPPEWIIDGLFGIGLSRPLSNLYAHVIQYAAIKKQQGAKILALDLPSGLHADGGYLMAHPDITPSILTADYTLTFIAHKPGLYMGYGRDVAGQIILADLDLPQNNLPQPYALLNDISLFKAALPQRYHASSKGSYGTVGIIGGSPGMFGAPILCGRAALLSGAGKTLIGFATPSAPVLDNAYPELMLTSAHTVLSPDFLKKYQALVLGPGLGDNGEEWIMQVLAQPIPCILDADALNQLTSSATLQQRIAARKTNHYPTLLTPHPLEAARLLNCTIDDIQNARIAAAKNLAEQFGAIVILKGSGTVIYNIGHPPVINPTGSGALATAGTGDVLAGVLAALIAQGMETYLAACASVWLHGSAADELTRQHCGPIGLNASALPTAVRRVLNKIT